MYSEEQENNLYWINKHLWAAIQASDKQADQARSDALRQVEKLLYKIQSNHNDTLEK